ncbi:peptidoglycan-recognition protein 1-like [Macrosteles quadrilineatus]|uniref:peptidoglycan-recognition protein 1-like n=1 Tax=Macrosteles quadrilineatus TaxID=74068 RepID=UPI0023E0EE83|nr:peptidoglycan-recognition protein 1-like [Macrosteles quadrilineatus]
MEFDVLPRFVTRTNWGAEPPIKVHLNNNPMEHVCFNYNTGTASCSGDEECFPLLRKMQKDYMDEGLSDIPFSFLVGGDGTIYEGRGWHVRSSSAIQGTTMSPRLDIGFLGTFHRDTVPKKMYFRGIDWVYYGVRMNLLIRMYSFQENRQPPRPKYMKTYIPYLKSLNQ